MASKFSQNWFNPKNPEKYVGNKRIRYRSSWELHFMRFCDTNPNIIKWASEAIQIPYVNPLTGKRTVYVPDFFIQYVDKTGKMIVELIEIKPDNQQILEKVGNNSYHQSEYIKNQAKWAAAHAYCQQNQIRFRVINQTELFVGTAQPKRRGRPKKL
jgi:hypothetical protein